MRLLSALVATLVMAMGFAGCTQDDASAAQGTDAPLGPRQLRVGQPLLGEYVRLAINSSGHQITYDFNGRDVEESIEVLSDHDYIERRIVAINGRDRYWSEFPAIQYQQRLTDLDPEDGQTAIYNQQTTYRRSDRFTQYDDVQTAFTSRSTSCGPSGCTSEIRTEDVDYRYYHKVAAPVDALTLAGRVLTLGRTTSVNYTWTDTQGLIYASWANYTAKREVDINGERTFLVEPKFETRILNQPELEKPSVGATSASEAPMSTEKEPKLPKPVREMYVSARLSTPIKQVIKSPFEYDGRVYWYNVTYELEAAETGTEPVPWGTEPRTNASRAGSVPVTELRNNLDMKAMKYPFSTAWKNLRADPALTEFQRISAKAAIVPVHATYFPDANDNAYTWSITLSDDAGRAVYAMTRLQGVGSGTGVYVPQDRENGMNWRNTQSLTADNAGGKTFAKAEDIYATFRAIRPGNWEPALALTLVHHPEYNMMATSMVLADPANVRPLFGNAAILGSEILRARDTVSFSALDGGLDSMNMTWMTLINEWPMRPPFSVPVPPQQAQVYEDARLVALLDRPWAEPVQPKA